MSDLDERSFIGLPSGSYQLEGAAIRNRKTGRRVVRAENRNGTAKKDRYYMRVRDNNLAYFMYDKTLGALDDKTLDAIAWANIDLAENISPEDPGAAELYAEYYELAASAFTEAAMVQTFAATDMIKEVDDRLELIDVADNCLERAIAGLPTEQTTTKHRLQIKLLFSRVHRDIVCGEIVEDTVEDLKKALYEELMNTFYDTDEIHARGLAGELRAYWHYWSEFWETGLAAIPATVRGDSGFYNRHDTHDFDILSQRDDGNWHVETPREIKRRRITQWMLSRYTGSDLVYVNPLYNSQRGVRTIQKAKTR